MSSLDKLDGVDCLHKIMRRGKEKQSMFQTVILILIVFTLFRFENVFYQQVEMEEHSALVHLM
jgi:hypothetical protein